MVESAEGVQRLIDRIAKDADRESDEIIAKAKESALALIKKKEDEARERAEKESQTILAQANEEADRIKKSAIAEAKIKANWAILSEKDSALERVIQDVKEELQKFTRTKEYRSVLESLVLDGARAMGGGDLEVLFNKNDSKLGIDLNALSEKASKELGKPTKLFASKENAEGIGGSIIKTIDGKIVIDNTLDRLIERRRKDITLKAAKILFSE
jgi:vacuolar-type H+-ATPase subunit E/Vma4